MEKGEEQQASKVMHIRVQGSHALVEDLATKIGEFLEANGYELIEQSGVYPSRFVATEAKVFITVR